MQRWILLLFLVVFVAPTQAQTNPHAVDRPARGVIEGRVVNAITHEPLADVQVRLALSRFGIGDPEAVFARTDRNGRFELNNLAPDSYYLSARLPSFLWPDSDARGAGIDLTRLGGQGNFLFCAGVDVTKTLEKDGALLRAVVEIQMYPAATISGKVTDPNGTLLADTRVTIRMVARIVKNYYNATPLPDGVNELHDAAIFSTDDRGEFRASGLRPGTYYVVAARPDYLDDSFKKTYFPSSLDPASANSLELAPGQQVRADIQIRRDIGTHLAGRFVMPSDAADELRYRTRLVLIPRPLPANDSGNHPYLQDLGGTFELRNVMPGAYTLVVATFELDPTSRMYLGKAVWGGKVPIDVGEGGLDDIAIEMRALPEISGTVKFAPGCTPGPVRIRVTGSGTPIYTRPEVLSDNDGKFTLTGLFAAHYTLTIRPQESSGQEGSGKMLAARFGERDVSTEGFDYPPADPGPLEITMACNAAGRAR